MELDITWQRAAKVWWSYLWRNLIAIILGALIGGLVGFVIALILVFTGVPADTIQVITTLIGAVIGLLISIVPIKMVLGKDFGEFRLALIKNEHNP